MAEFTWQSALNTTAPSSCPGGVCNYGGGTSTPWTWNTDPNYAGRYGGQETLLDIFAKNRAWCERWREANLAYNSMLRQYQGPESTWIRWFLKYNKGAIIGSMLGKTPSAKTMSKGWLDRYISGDLPLHTGREGEFFREYRGELPAIPDWMQEYIMPTTTKEEGRGTRESTTYTLRPLGAQERLNAEQQAQLAGFLAWSKAGFPTRWGEDALIAMSDIERHWTPYATESQSMFSRGVQKPKWATMTQR